MEGLRTCEGTYRIFEDGSYKDRSFQVGYFHGWGMRYDEFEAGPGTYSVAIVELPDGSVVTPDPSQIRFTDRDAAAS